MTKMKFAEASLIAAVSMLMSKSTLAAVCLPEDGHHVVLSRGLFGWPPVVSMADFSVVVRANIGESAGGYISGVTVSFLDGGHCKVALEVTVPEMDSARVQAEQLGKLPIVDVVTEEHGGSGHRFAHRLFAMETTGLQPIPAPVFEHTNMGGFFVGDLGGNRGAGAVVWDASWDDGAHYDPHRYIFHFYRWHDGRLEIDQTIKTPFKVEPSPDRAAASMRFPFRDQTGPELMPFTVVQHRSPSLNFRNGSTPVIDPRRASRLRTGSSFEPWSRHSQRPLRVVLCRSVVAGKRMF